MSSKSRLERADGIQIENAHADAAAERIFLGPEWEPHERVTDGGMTMVRREEEADNSEESSDSAN
jgi:hypothetical protein